MSRVPARFIILKRVATGALSVAVFAALCGCAYGAYLSGGGEWRTGLALLAGSLGLALLAVLVYCQVVLLIKFASNSFRAYDTLLDITELLRRQSDFARTVADNSTLSDWAKRIVYREKDYEFLRDTIQSAIVRQDWPAVEHLIRELDEQLGYREEAERLRVEVTSARHATNEQKIAAALQRFESVCLARKWDQAVHESRRLRSLFGGDPRIAGLEEEVELRRQQYKRQLLKDYEQAVQRHELDRAHQLLFELDQYLASNEAAALKDSARGVFKAKLQQMGVQFSLAVSDRQYASAIDVGQRLIKEFPNSRFAAEITAMLPALRQRVAAGADGQHAVAAS